jgi:hypothetical protein
MLRAVSPISILLFASLVSCTEDNSEPVQIVGNHKEARLVLRYIRAAESGDTATFKMLTRQSVERTFTPPTISDVDRTDESCSLRSLEGLTKMVWAFWDCPQNTKEAVQRTFLVEAGHVTAIWNEGAEPPTVPADLSNVR